MRLNLPVQGVIDRRTLHLPTLVVRDVTGRPVTAPRLLSSTTLPNDPGVLHCRADRGWHCRPGIGCVWRGLL